MISRQAKRKSSVYLLYNTSNSKFRFRAARFIQDLGFVPVYSTIMTDFFGMKQDPRKAKDSRSSLIRKCEHVWVFGEINATMWDQINYAKSINKQIKYYDILPNSFKEVNR